MSNSEQQDRSQEIDEAFREFNRLKRILENLDDRGVILSIAAFAEDVLGELLKAFMLPAKTSNELLDGFNAPLGTFSSRIKAAYSFGLITRSQFIDLEHLRKIRNQFAHTWESIDFSHPEVSKHISGISYSSIHDDFPETPAEKILTALPTLLIELQVTAQRIERQGKRADEIGRHLLSGFPGDFNSQFKALKNHINAVEANISTADGEKLAFYENVVIKRLHYRLYTVAASAPPDRLSEVLLLHQELIIKFNLEPPPELVAAGLFNIAPGSDGFDK